LEKASAGRRDGKRSAEFSMDDDEEEASTGVNKVQ
jgi:hypothetical protein